MQGIKPKVVYRNNKRPRRRNFHERVVSVRGVHASISDNRGALIIWGKLSHNGMRVTLTGKGSDNRVKHISSDASFVKHPYSFTTGIDCYCVFNRVVPGNYYVTGVTATSVTIAPGIVTQLDWT